MEYCIGSASNLLEGLFVLVIFPHVCDVSDPQCMVLHVKIQNLSYECEMSIVFFV